MSPNKVYFLVCDCGNFTICCKTEEQLNMEYEKHNKYCKQIASSTTHTPINPNGILSQREIDELTLSIKIFNACDDD
jgi:hypothetical protein